MVVGGGAFHRANLRNRNSNGMEVPLAVISKDSELTAPFTDRCNANTEGFMSDINARYQGTIPEFYHRYLGPVMFEPYAADLARRISVPGGGSILEIACGTGMLTRQLYRQVAPSVRLVATDLNEPMIDFARSQTDRDAKIEWRPADATALPFPDASFDAVVCQFGVMFFPDKKVAFNEARRVLPAGGLLAFNVWGAFERNPYARIAHETVGRFFPEDPPEFFHVPFGFSDREVLRQLLTDSGFGEIEFEWVTLQAKSPSARSFALGLIEGYPVSLAIKERGLAPEPVVEAVAAALTRFGGDQPFSSTMGALVVTARALPA